MTDDHPQHSDEFEPVEPLARPSTPLAPKGQVRSGLAERKSPQLEWLKEAGQAFARFWYKDLLRTGLILASIAITITFFSLLGSTKPSSPGVETPLSEVAKKSDAKQILTASLLDGDGRVVVQTKDGQLFWAAYPSSGASTQQLVDTLGKNGAHLQYTAGHSRRGIRGGDLGLHDRHQRALVALVAQAGAVMAPTNGVLRSWIGKALTGLPVP